MMKKYNIIEISWFQKSICQECLALADKLSLKNIFYQYNSLVY